MKKLFYSYEEFIKDLHILVKDIEQSGFIPDYVVGIARGGVIPATYISHYFKKPFEIVHISLLDSQERLDKTKISDSCIKLRNLLRQEKKLLFVDDICDSGNTLYSIKTSLSPLYNSEFVKFLTLFNNQEQELFKPDFFVKEIKKQTDPIWIEYFYENWPHIAA